MSERSTVDILPVSVPMMWGTQRPGACSMQWVLAWNRSTLVRWRTRAGSSTSFSCSVRAWRCRNRACLQTHTITSELNVKNPNWEIYVSTTSPFSCLPSWAWIHTLQHRSLGWSGSLRWSAMNTKSMLCLYFTLRTKATSWWRNWQETYFAIQAVVQLQERPFGFFWQFAHNLQSDLRQHIRDIQLTQILDSWFKTHRGYKTTETPRVLSDFVGDGAGVLHGHHQVSSQEVNQDVSDICAHGLQDMLGNVDLGFICMRTVCMLS